MSWARIETAQPGELGRPREGGYDRILVSAAATSLPEPLVMQLAPGGRMVIPVHQTLLLVEHAPYPGPQGEPMTVEDWGLRKDRANRTDRANQAIDPGIGNQLRVTEHGAYAFVPLVH